MTKRRVEEDRLRSERADLIHLSMTMPPSEHERRQRVRRLLQENTHRLRQLIVDRAMDPCTRPECVLEGTVSEDAKQWCPLDAAQRWTLRPLIG